MVRIKHLFVMFLVTAPPDYKSVSLKLIEKFCRIALKQPDRHRALKFCSLFLSFIEAGLFGMNNKGMLFFHHLIHGVKKGKASLTVIERGNKERVENLRILEAEVNKNEKGYKEMLEDLRSLGKEKSFLINFFYGIKASRYFMNLILVFLFTFANGAYAFDCPEANLPKK